MTLVFNRGPYGAYGVQAYDPSQVSSDGYIPTVATPPIDNPLSQDPSLSIESSRSVTITATDVDVPYSRTFSGRRMEVQTSNQDLTDQMINDGITSRVLKIYVEYSYYYDRNGYPDELEGTLRRAVFTLQIQKDPPTEPNIPNAPRQVVQRGSVATFFHIPEYFGPTDKNTISKLLGPVYDIPYQSSSRVRMLPANFVTIEVPSIVHFNFGPVASFDPLSSIGFNVSSMLSTLSTISLYLGLPDPGEMVAYKYGYFIYNGPSLVNHRVGINSVLQLCADESLGANPANAGLPVQLADGSVVSDGSARWPVFKIEGGHGIIVKLRDGYSKVLCVTKKPVNFGASLYYVGKGIVEGPPGDPRMGVSSEIIREAGPLNYAYVSEARLKSYLMAGGNTVSYVQLSETSRIKVPFDGALAPLFAVNTEVDPSKKYIVIFIPDFNAVVSNGKIISNDYSPGIYITFQSCDEVLARRIHLDKRRYALINSRNPIIASGGSSCYHSKSSPTVIREIDAVHERCLWSRLGGEGSSGLHTPWNISSIPSLSSGVYPRSLSYRTYLKALNDGVENFVSYASESEEFADACVRTAAVEDIETGRPRIGNPLIPPNQTEDADLPDLVDDSIGVPVRIELPRISQIVFNQPTGRLIDFPNGFFFADIRGICYMTPSEEVRILFPAASIPNRSWWNEWFSGLTGLRANLTVQTLGSVQLYFDISEACNSCLPDDLKIPYQGDLALAISKASKYSNNVLESGIGIPRLDFFRKFSASQSRVGTFPNYGQPDFPDLSLAEFDIATKLTPPTDFRDAGDFDPTTGLAIFNGLRRAGTIQNINLTRDGRLAVENVGSGLEQLGKSFLWIRTTGGFDALRAGMDINNRDGMVAARSESKHSMFHIESSQSHRMLASLSQNQSLRDADDEKWFSKDVIDISAPLKSKSLFGGPFDVIPTFTHGSYGLVNQLDAFTARKSDITFFGRSRLNLAFAKSGNFLIAQASISSNSVITQLDISLDVKEKLNRSQLLSMYASISFDDPIQIDGDKIIPDKNSRCVFWLKLDDQGRCRLNGPFYGSNINIVLSSSTALPDAVSGSVSVRSVSSEVFNKWYPDTSAAAPFIDSYGCINMMMASQDENLGLCCLASCDGYANWNMMSHVMQGFVNERVEDVLVKSDHMHRCSYCVFRKDGMLLCKRVEDLYLASDTLRMPKAMLKESFQVGFSEQVSDFVYAMYKTPYEQDSFAEGETEAVVSSRSMQVRLTPANLVYANFETNEEARIEMSNYEALKSGNFIKTIDKNVSEADGFFPRIASAYSTKATNKFSKTVAGKMDFDPVGSYSFEVLPNGTLFLMMVHENSLHPFKSSDGGRTWAPALAPLSYALRPVKYSLDDADSIYNIQNETLNLGDCPPIDGVHMCVDRHSDQLLLLYSIEGAIFGQYVPCARMCNSDSSAIGMFSTAWLSSATTTEHRPFYVMGSVPEDFQSALSRRRVFPSIDKIYLNTGNNLEQRLGVDTGNIMPTIVNLQDGMFRIYYMSDGKLRAGFIIGKRTILDAQLI